MAVTLYHTGTEYTSNAITLLRGAKTDITTVGVYHNTDPTHIPLVSEFITVTLADGIKVPPDALAIPGELDVVARIGPKAGADVNLSAGTYQRWVLVQTATQDLIRAADTVVIL
jgi:hypothetical protein